MHKSALRGPLAAPRTYVVEGPGGPRVTLQARGSRAPVPLVPALARLASLGPQENAITRCLSQKLFGLESRFVEEHPTLVTPYTPSCEVLPPGTVFGRVRLGIAFLETEEEARNFLAWYSTPFVRALLAAGGDLITSFARGIPVPSSFTTGVDPSLDFTSPESLQEQLCALHGVTPEEREAL